MNRMSKKQWGATLVAILLATVFYVLSLLTPEFIAGTGPYWQAPYSDRITNLVGFLYYLQDEWRFPLFNVPRLGYPEGTNIVFTDSIPLLALAAKLVYKTTGFTTNYFGWWVLGCYLLLALFIALAARAARIFDPLALIACALFAISAPALITRIGHASLMAHFLIAWGLLLYLRTRSIPLRSSDGMQFALIAVFVVTMQAYFLPMVLIFLFASLVHAVAEKRCSLRFATLSLATFFGASALAAWAAGIIGTAGTSAPAWGFGHYSMNLVSPFLPPRHNLPEAWATHVRWDPNDYTWDATAGQYEGYNYLGAGLLFLVAIVLIVPGTRQKLWSNLRRHAVLVVCLLGCACYALSNRVFIGDYLVLEVPLSQMVAAFTGHFRTGGRMFWPVYYVLVISLIGITMRYFSRSIARAIVLLALLFQLISTQVLRDDVAIFASAAYPQLLDRTTWRTLVETHDFIEQYPSFQCGGWANTWPENNANMELQLIAAASAKPINSAYVARAVKDCKVEQAQGLAFDVRPGGLYFFAGDFPLASISDKPRFSELCREFKFGVVCTQTWSALDAHSKAGKFPLTPVFIFPDYELGRELKFVTHGNGRRFMGQGWSTPEPWGTWSTGKVSEVFVKLPNGPGASWTVEAEATAFVHPARKDLDVTVFANGANVGTWMFRHGEGTVHRSLIVPIALVKANGDLRLTFIPSSLQSPKEAGLSADVRPLGFALVNMRLNLVQ